MHLIISESVPGSILNVEKRMWDARSSTFVSNTRRQEGGLSLNADGRDIHFCIDRPGQHGLREGTELRRVL